MDGVKESEAILNRSSWAGAQGIPFRYIELISIPATFESLADIGRDALI